MAREPLARRTTWLVPKTTSAVSISSCVFGADSMTRIFYKYAHLPTFLLFFTFLLTGPTHSLQFDFQREHYYSLYSTNGSIPTQKCIYHTTILLLITPFRRDFFQLQKQQKFRQTTERNKQYGRRHIPPNIHY